MITFFNGNCGRCKKISKIQGVEDEGEGAYLGM